jgi:hypothetical protein
VPVHGASPPTFQPPQPSEERKDIRSTGELFPGGWTTTRDEVNHKTTVRWHGKTETTYPWGKETDYESLIYDADDAHPEISAVEGEAKTIFELKERVLTWQGHLSVTTDQRTLFYKYTRELSKNGKLIKTKTWQEAIPRDHQ